MTEGEQHGSANQGGNVHPRDMEEYALLRNQAQMWEGATRHVLRTAGIAAGMSCLDVGAGPGSVMQTMSEGVGPQGHVVGIETEARIANIALAELRQRGGATFDIVTGDLHALDDLPGAPFDISFCRLVLMHMPDPVSVLEKMQAWTKPGGIVIAQEFDFGSIAVEPPCPPMAEFLRVFEGVFLRLGRNMRAGRQLPTQFESAGLGMPEGTHAELKFLPLADMTELLISVYQSVYDAAVKFGLTDASRSARFAQEMREAGQDGRYYCLTATLIAAWTRAA